MSRSTATSTSSQNWKPIKLAFARLALLSFAIFFLDQQALAQGPAVSTLSSSLSQFVDQSQRKTVAVVDFTDLKGCVTELGRYMAEDISVALARNARGFKVIDRTNLKVLLAEHKLASTGIIDPATARKLGQIAGVDALVTGTIAPLSDTVHVSAKVLDTKTAMVLGGTTVDMPKTKNVQELLAKGVTNCGQSTGDISGDMQATGGNASSEKLKVVTTGQIGNFIIAIRECRRLGDQVRCTGSIVNSGRIAEPFDFFVQRSYMVDSLGNRSAGLIGGWGSVNSGGVSPIEPGIPLTFWLAGTGLSLDATSISIVLIAKDVNTPPPLPGSKFTFKNIRIYAR